MNKGLIIGKFSPMHVGHKYAAVEASMQCAELTVLVCIDHLHDPGPLTPEQRIEIVEKEFADFPNIKVETIDCTAFPYAKEDDLEVSKYWANVLFERYPDLGTLFGSEQYVKFMADNWPNPLGIRHQIIDIDRSTFNISATKIRNEPHRYFNYLVDSAKPYFTKHVLVIGCESCGKSTLVRNLGEVLEVPTIPEMYRSIYPGKAMDFSAESLIHVAQTQVRAVNAQVLSPFNTGLIIHDTCCDVTLKYLLEYYPDALTERDAVISIRDKEEVSYDLIIFCDNNIPWENDGTRDKWSPEDRKRMRDEFYSLAVQKGKRHNCPVEIVDADYKRIPDALKLIKGIL